MVLLSAREAAARLQVSPQRVQQRIEDGSLPAARVGDRWVIDERDLVSPARLQRAGRPLSSRSSWAVLMVAAGRAGGLTPVERSRAKARLGRLVVNVAGSADSDAVARVSAFYLRNRADRFEFVANPLDLADLRGDARVALSGLSHSRAGIQSGGVEGYVSADSFARIVDDYLLSPGRGGVANVVLHRLPEWLEAVELDLLDSDLLLAADLLQHRGPRELAAGAQLAQDFAKRWRG